MPIKNDAVLITFVGRLIWTKGITYLYEAIKKLQKTPVADNLIFVLAGPGELEKPMKEQIAQDKLENKIFLTGDLSYEQVRSLLGMSDIFVNPSHHNEGFPNTILEAGSAGCFVIATDNAGTSEVIKNGKTGALILQKDVKAIEDAIYWAATHKEMRLQLAENLKTEILKNFDWKSISNQLYQLLSDDPITKRT